MSLAQSPSWGPSLSDLAGDRRAFRRLPELKGAPAVFRAALRLIARNWAIGAVTFFLPSGQELFIAGREPGPHARLTIHDYRFIRRALSAGDIGFAEAYIAGEFDTPDLPDLLYVFAANWDRVHHVTMGNPLAWTMNRIRHALKPNSRQGAKKNIHAHYDLGNAFYAQWLDPTMTYSSAKFERPGQPLPEAQTAKYKALAQSMGLQPGQSVLEIGCGWGGFAEFAAKTFGTKVVGLTISLEQRDFAQARIHKAGLSDQVEIRLQDYRDERDRYDRIASIEMIEAVGEQFWPNYFSQLRDRLLPGGLAGIQAITIQDSLFQTYRREVDFIQRYVFPGGMLPSPQILKALGERFGVPVIRERIFGQDYAKTLAIWRSNYRAAWPHLMPSGFDDRFRRLWEYYLAYCEAGFLSGNIDVRQVVFAKSG
jgi:cyclopropane-fatty-acyl-phospholipid synthase